MASDSGADAELRERVAQLEETVAEQQATIEALSSPTASRRGVLAALTGVAGAGALGTYSQRGAAQAAGQVGTSSKPLDVEAWSLNVQDSATLGGDLDAGGNSVTNVEAVEATSGTIDSLDGTDLQYEQGVITDKSDRAIRVPDDYNTVSAAVERVRELALPHGTTVQIHIQSGHTFQKIVQIEHADLRHVRITSANATVPVDETGLTDVFGNGRPPMFLSESSTFMPAIDCVFDGGGGGMQGLQMFNNCQAVILEGAGFQNMAWGASAIRGSILEADSAILKDMSGRGAQMGAASFAHMNDADLSGCQIGLRQNNGSVVSAQGVDFSDASNVGLRMTQSSMCDAKNATIQNCATNGVRITNAARVSLSGATVSNNTDLDVNFGNGSYLVMHNCTTTNGTPDAGDVDGASSFNVINTNGVIMA